MANICIINSHFVFLMTLALAQLEAGELKILDELKIFGHRDR
jgi:hypothetical protein